MSHTGTRTALRARIADLESENLALRLGRRSTCMSALAAETSRCLRERDAAGAAGRMFRFMKFNKRADAMTRALDFLQTKGRYDE